MRGASQRGPPPLQVRWRNILRARRAYVQPRSSLVPPPETSPLSPLPSPSHRPGEGDFTGVMVPLGWLSTPLPILKLPPTKHHRLNRVPLSRTVGGRWERGQGHTR